MNGLVLGCLMSVCGACSLLADLSALTGESGGSTGFDATADADSNVAATADASDASDDDASDASLPVAYLVGVGSPIVVDGGEVLTTGSIFARIGTDGVLGQWRSGPELPSARLGHAVFGMGAAVHVLGGRPNSAANWFDEVFTSRMQADQTFGAFTPSLSLVEPDGCPRPARIGSRAYAVKSAAPDSVQYATVSGDGFGAWQRQSGLTAGLTAETIPRDGATVSVGSQLFLFGWANKAVVSTATASGALTPWQALPQLPLNFQPGIGGAAVSGRYIYLVGGYVIGSTDVDNRVFVSEVASEGALGEWRETEPFPLPRIGYGVVRHGDYLYLIGGTRFGAALDDVSSARIRDDGTLAPWQTNTPMPSARRGECTFAVVVR